jgi:hypothetical protein
MLHGKFESQPVGTAAEYDYRLPDIRLAQLYAFFDSRHSERIGRSQHSGDLEQTVTVGICFDYGQDATSGRRLARLFEIIL